MDEIALLEGLLERYSPTYQEKEAAAFLTGQLSEAGFSTFIDEAGSAVAMKGSGSHEILLLGHIDTVPGQIPVRREGDLLYGRGAVDAKGPLACFAAAAARVTPPPGWRVTVIGAVGEEEDSRGARHLRSRHHPAMLVIGEPSKWDHITLGFRGSVWLNYQVARPVGHTAGPDESACEAAVAFWQRVRAWTSAANEGIPQVYNQVSATIRGMQSSSDGFEDKALLRIGVRLPPALTL
ncbi:MAG TPA: M20/M25/M40 family metallo-hydrolase, partial [Longimicrobiales bacterium]